MRTVKLVVIGTSGVGKSSIRNQYISGRFTTGYRATIGADFITKILPHHDVEGESVTLQIWDTAGQERFSSLSSAFFRGADAAVLMFDVNQPQTMHALTKWWDDFRDKAPVLDERMDEFCCVVVGNKIDLAQADGGAHAVSQVEALRFVDELVPSSSNQALPDTPTPFNLHDSLARDAEARRVVSSTESTLDPDPIMLFSDADETPRSDSIAIHAGQRRPRGVSRSRSRSTLFRGGTTGTMTSTRTVYHTPSSSLFDTFHSALSSPAWTALSASRSSSHSPVRSPRRVASSSTISSVPTITPSLFARETSEDLTTTSATTPASGTSPAQSCAIPAPPERGAKLFFTSAKTGEGVRDVFEYVARRVVARREYEEAVEARTLHIHDGAQRIRLDGAAPEQPRAAVGGVRAQCCT